MRYEGTRDAQLRVRVERRTSIPGTYPVAEVKWWATAAQLDPGWLILEEPDGEENIIIVYPVQELVTVMITRHTQSTSDDSSDPPAKADPMTARELAEYYLRQTT